MSKNKYKRGKLILIPFGLIVGIILLSLFFLQPFERYSSSSVVFKNACKRLEGENFTFQNIRSLQGYCFESCGENCSHSVNCTSDHLQQRIAMIPFVVTKNPGAPEGYYCKISTDSQNKIKAILEFVTD